MKIFVELVVSGEKEAEVGTVNYIANIASDFQGITEIDYQIDVWQYFINVSFPNADKAVDFLEDVITKMPDCAISLVYRTNVKKIDWEAA